MSTDLKSDELRLGWADDPQLAAPIAEFFCAHADAEYISHSELQEARAIAPGVWNPDLRSIMHAQASKILARPAIDGTADAIACAWLDGELAGMALVSFGGSGEGRRFAVLDDMVVSPAVRGRGLGRQFIEWIAARAGEFGARRLFLESGVGNDSAHRFFERAGFRQTSIVMMRDL